MKKYKSNFEDFQNDQLVATELKVIRGGDGIPPANPDPTDQVDPKKGGGNGNP
ncbi:rSAM-modified peptide [Flavobacterium chungbukense]|uniref:Serine endopeptidase n=1 Tax=Flavobacterium chungbukense TaxID=877464 RepID=A0ABP7XWQ2_9FLAO|nr:rSAM-modified peptide [Flavobacterium chungbukense]MCC4921779.1 rSAM-modified peptide [Flavobacterium chungbukense]MCC4921780.1 rSAM-modified peptide [Flavobacterium chungbukense]MCC4921781.1 rSAM-modified peptide [Flavobacterium chungbukense]